ncbi:helix-turn-helix transcriptional regulator [Candidatus Symbiopectobacterium sp. NZEC135]|uniref:helix-turn-helix transcriptional regulator n=1 Tax=Candidatus Symbiopectobacterium sp. NZEC135 TaxID=2820471 RepID=UPI002226A8EC|nr:WYL domain-containing protein [Candidatus Symbiopectobacterium sp. NZEC135]MCW2480431.1 WYL domain-containing protein [Candidatus Symbiopectobacterium sp. NZEC135]
MGKKNLLLASRLADILLRFNRGETLTLNGLAEEYGVHPRTIRRDIEDRLAIAGVEKDTVKNSYSLRVEYLGKFDASSIDTFAEVAGVKELFPALDKKILQSVFYPTPEQNILVMGHRYIKNAQQTENFTRLQQAISECRRIDFSYFKRAEHHTYHVEPYQLINHSGIWYLAANHNGKMKKFTLSKISALHCTFDIFKRSSILLNDLKNEESVWSNELKFEVVIKVSPEVAEYFQRRDLVIGQVVEKELTDGGLIISARISHKNEVLPIVQYWLPHVRIVSPESLRQELETTMRHYLGIQG